MKIVRDVIKNTVVKKRAGTKNCLLKDEEAYIVATSEIYGAHRLPIDTTNLTNELQQVLHGVVKHRIVNVIKLKYTQRYHHRVIELVNKEEGKAEEKNQYRSDKSFSPQPQ